jgi:cobalt-zinc-cadmium efflux system membrane fusion protein
MRREYRFTTGGFLMASLLLFGAGCSDTGGPPSTAEADDGLYCKEHGVPEKFCTLCHDELKSSLLLCKEHGGIPEEICTLCHPEAAEKHHVEVCPNGHGLPKYFCTRCSEKPAT